MTNENYLMTFDRAIENMKSEVDRVLSASPLIIREYTLHLSNAKGKFIRAVSLITCAQNDDGMVCKNAVTLAAAVEILHLATLVHDDVMDNADKRRGIVTLQKKYGKKTAVICGDYLLCVALKLVSSVPNKEDYLNFNVPDYMSRVCLGELFQHINNGNFDLSAYNYLKIISGKTAALFEASYFAGAVLSEKNASVIKKLTRLGHYTGMIFQLTDDIMDYEVSEDTARKPVQSDYEQGVITLPIIYTFKKTKGFKERAKAEKLSRTEIIEAVLRTGGLKFTRSVSKRYYSKAEAILKELQVNDDSKTRLFSILDKAFKRQG